MEVASGQHSSQNHVGAKHGEYDILVLKEVNWPIKYYQRSDKIRWDASPSAIDQWSKSFLRVYGLYC